MQNSNHIEPALFLEKHYEEANNPLRTATRLEAILMDMVKKQCAMYTTDAYYDAGWIKMLLILNKVYIKLDPGVVEDERYKNSTLWVSRWLLELLQRRPQLSANNVCASLDELQKERESLVESLREKAQNLIQQPTNLINA